MNRPVHLSAPSTGTTTAEAYVDAFVQKNLTLTSFAQRNRCKDLTCVYQKLVCHKMYRDCNCWQSFLLHRYFWNVQHTSQGNGLNVHHMQMKQVISRQGSPIWVYSWGRMSPSTWTLMDETENVDQEYKEPEIDEMAFTVVLVEM